MGALEMTTEALQKQGKNTVRHILPSTCWGKFVVSKIQQQCPEWVKGFKCKLEKLGATSKTVNSSWYKLLNKTTIKCSQLLLIS
jgi:hypothetical protein